MKDIARDSIEEQTVRLARAAGQRIAAAWDRPRRIDFKGEVDLVTETDRAVEEYLVKQLRHFFPTHRIVAEESAGGVPSEDGVPTWYVDPLDGTTNFAHGYPHVAVSLGLVDDQGLQVGVVHDVMRSETFSAVRGHGARLNGRPIYVSRTARLDQALIGTGFPYDRRVLADTYLRFVADVMKRAQGIRRAGSAALDLAWVAAGRLDGFWELKLQPWDVAAGALLVAEAGGRVSDFAGGPFEPWAVQILASNGHFHDELSGVLAARFAVESELHR